MPVMDEKGEYHHVTKVGKMMETLAEDRFGKVSWD